MADIDDFDIDRSIAQAWADFQGRLSEIISLIDSSGDLTISSGSIDDVSRPSSEVGTPLLRFSCKNGDVVRCVAAGNASLAADFQLTESQQEAMEQLGWQRSGRSTEAGDSTEAGERAEPGDYWAERRQDESDQLSELAVAALRDVYGVQHPIFLAPDQLAEVLHPSPTPIEETPSVNGGRPILGQPDRRRLNDLVDLELTTMFGHPPIRDAEGDVAIRVGSTMLFLRTAPDGQEIMLFAAVVHDVSGRSRAAEVLNDLNVEARWVKFKLVRDRVFVTYSLLAQPFVPAHLHQAVRIVSEVADGIDDELASKLNGRTTFSERDPDS